MIIARCKWCHFNFYSIKIENQNQTKYFLFPEHERNQNKEVLTTLNLTDEDIKKQWKTAKLQKWYANSERKKQDWEARASYEAGSTLMSNLINQGFECNQKATILSRSESGEYVGCKRKVVGKLSSKTQMELLAIMDKTISGRVAEEMLAKTRDGKYFIKKIM